MVFFINQVGSCTVYYNWNIINRVLPVSIEIKFREDFANYDYRITKRN
ncbi:hypothetical protein SAMN04488113_10555 [Alkalibacterium gilvum]|uniref:Uncharacterized protein n=1 Tax=Alkalibacterium gilvum TaxID=1130080 RepID=A0A1H6S2J9_9LACT|nr:hypothetical protein SAMN04488113_10555 [Alkalibacterium gilvum]